MSNMAGITYKLAREVLNETERNKLLCMYLNSTVTSTDWQKAAEDYGSTSGNSFQTMSGTIKTKLNKAYAASLKAIAVAALAEGEESDDEASPMPTPTPKPKKATGNLKRKNVITAEDDEPAPATKRQRGGKKGKKAAAAAAVGGEDDEEAAEDIKAEEQA